MSEADLGTDLDCLEDLGPTMAETTGFPVFVQDLIHRLETMRLGLLDDPDYGRSVAELASKKLTARELNALPRTYEEELAKDDRVKSIRITATLNGETVRMRFDVDSLEGPFQFTADVSKAGALVLESMKR